MLNGSEICIVEKYTLKMNQVLCQQFEVARLLVLNGQIKAYLIQL